MLKRSEKADLSKKANFVQLRTVVYVKELDRDESLVAEVAGDENRSKRACPELTFEMIVSRERTLDAFKLVQTHTGSCWRHAQNGGCRCQRPAGISGVRPLLLTSSELSVVAASDWGRASSQDGT
jgi:hypothetical protein